MGKTRPFMTHTAPDGRGNIVTRHISEKQALKIAEKIVFGPMRERRAFFESEGFDRLMTQFHDAARIAPLDQEDLAYGRRTRLPFTADQFRMAVEVVMECAPGETVEDKTETGGFPRATKHYKGLDFIVLIGQGSRYIVQQPQPPKAKP